MHRIGRTGRNGQAGWAASLVTVDELRMLNKVEEYMDAALPLLPLPEPDEAEEKAFWALQRKKAEPRAGRDAALNHSILRLSIGGGRKSKMRTGDIVGTICSISATM